MLAGLSIGWMQLLVLVSCGLVPPAKDIGLAQGFFGSCRNICGSIASKLLFKLVVHGALRLINTLPSKQASLSRSSVHA
jgi:sugar phosphate permease